MKKYLFIAVALLLMVAASETKAQRVQSFESEYSFSSDTTTDTGTSYLTVRAASNGSAETTVQVIATKISGTVAGTLSLLGSLDGTNFKALNVRDSTVAVPTFTATNVASQNFIWRITGNPVPYYRISWTGSGTMAASFVGYLQNRE